MLGFDNPVHLLILLGVLLLLFGAKRLPEMGRSLGEGLRGFKDSVTADPSQAELTPAPAMTAPASASQDAAVKEAVVQ